MSSNSGDDKGDEKNFRDASLTQMKVSTKKGYFVRQSRRIFLD